MIALRVSYFLRCTSTGLRNLSTTTTKPKTGVVLVNMGGPERVDQVHDYLHRIMTDRDMIQLPIAQDHLGPWIAKRRTPEVQKKYQEIGGGSPILKWTQLQGKLLCEKLDRESPETAPHKPYVAFRYVEPFTADAFSQMENDEVQHAIIFSQFPQYSCATSGSSFNEIYKLFQKRTIPNGMRMTVIDRWPTHPLLAKCFADNINKELQQIPEDKRKQAIILFSAHSLPLKAVNRGDAYPSEVGATVHQVMQELNFSQPYQLVWQSKVGPLPWLGPMTDEAIKSYVKQGKKTFVVVPIAFVNEHIETLHELDIEYCKELAEEVGVEIIRRVPAPNDHPLFIEALCDIVKTHIKNKIPVSSKFLNRCPHCINPNCVPSKKWYSEVCAF
ncbi:ferrochelatase, mitochondrial [Leptinotarsa decemlineata]|uniref:ferrochelatase, mitochondrial n=1 Tax=Leptinotarsa decemlineata TaxID=7539 RepID=UPI003D30601F